MITLPTGNHEMAEHLKEVSVTGQLAAEDGQPVELDMVVYDEEGVPYAMTVMTVDRFEAIRDELPEGHEEENAPHIFVLNEDRISLDSLAELLKSPHMRVFIPYLQRIEDTPEAA